MESTAFEATTACICVCESACEGGRGEVVADEEVDEVEEADEFEQAEKGSMEASEIVVRAGDGERGSTFGGGRGGRGGVCS